MLLLIQKDKGKEIRMMIDLQCTLFSTTGKYKPMSTIVKVESVAYYKAHKTEVQTRAIQKICIQRKTEPWCLKRDGFTRMKVRVYDKEKIEAENAERYERIKKERGWA